MKKRAIWLFLACSLALSACASPKGEAGEPSLGAEALSRPEAPARQELVFLVDRGDDPLYREAALLFADKVGELTGGMLTVQVTMTPAPAADYLDGKGDALFLDGGRAPGFHGGLTQLASPMLYKNYDAFTIALNAEPMLEMLREQLEGERPGSTPLAAYYGGSDFLAVVRSKTGGEVTVFEEPAEGEGKETLVAKPRAVLRKGSSMASMLEEYGMEPAEESDASARFRELVAGKSALAEFSLEEVEQANWRGTGLTLVSMGHSSSPRWLLIQNKRYEMMSPKYRAALQEAAAYLFPVIDGGIRQREDLAFARVREQGGMVTRSFPSLRAFADQELSKQAEQDVRWNMMREIIRSVE